eukprot:Nk52_evm82s485 gene=Nk52_evmTU82s485
MASFMSSASEQGSKRPFRRSSSVVRSSLGSRASRSEVGDILKDLREKAKQNHPAGGSTASLAEQQHTSHHITNSSDDNNHRSRSGSNSSTTAGSASNGNLQQRLSTDSQQGKAGLSTGHAVGTDKFIDIENTHDHFTGTVKELFQERPLSRRERIFLLFDDPSYSDAAYYLAVWVLILIVIATINFLLETLPELNEYSSVWFGIETFVVVQFTIEYAVKFFTCPHKRHFVFGWMNMIDLCAIVPYYIEVILLALGSSSEISGLAVIRVIRLARVFRLFKLSRYSSSFGLVVKVLWKSRDAFYLLMFMMVLAVLLFSSGIYYAELAGSEDIDGVWVYKETGKISPFQSILHSVWWSVVTMTSVGYGDVVPFTPQGKVVATLCMIVGILTLAFPITILGSNFRNYYVETKADKDLENSTTDEFEDELMKHCRDPGVELDEKQLRFVWNMLVAKTEMLDQAVLDMEIRACEMNDELGRVVEEMRLLNSHTRAYRRISEDIHSLMQGINTTNNKQSVSHIVRMHETGLCAHESDYDGSTCAEDRCDEVEILEENETSTEKKKKKKKEQSARRIGELDENEEEEKRPSRPLPEHLMKYEQEHDRQANSKIGSEGDMTIGGLRRASSGTGSGGLLEPRRSIIEVEEPSETQTMEEEGEIEVEIEHPNSVIH